MAEILVVHVGGRQIRTTPLHEFFTCDRGKIPARDLKPGDLLPGHAGGPMPVDRIEFTGKVEPVYNVRVADFHTYFVGSPEWGFSVWAHNIYRMTVAQAEAEAMQQHAEGLANTPIPEPVADFVNEFSNASEGPITNGSVSQAIEQGVIDAVEEPAADPQHHIFAQAQRAWFEARNVNIDDYTLELPLAEHQGIHGGGNWQLGRTWEGEWNNAMMSVLNDAEMANNGQYLTPEQILKIGRGQMADYGIDGPLQPYRK